ncbi:MAG: ribosome biogenesis GTPase Der [Chloroflexota bacterium]
MPAKPTASPGTTRLGGALPVVAVVGRPNVGKSTLFNRIVGGRTAIVEDRAHTTRDRLYGDAEWNGRRFVVVDTGGLDLDPDGPIEAGVQDQARLAIAEADVIVLVVDAVAGLTPPDAEAAAILRRAPAPVIVAVNKADNEKRELDGMEFHALGWEETYAISATHGRGTGDLLDAVVWSLPPETEQEIARKAREEAADAWADEVAAGRLEPFVVDQPEEGDRAAGDDGEDADDALDMDAEAAKWDAAIAAEADTSPASIAFVGRPNVGKSSLLNALLGEDRAIVSEVPGTTRDAIDTRLAWGRSEVILIDTAGIRRRGKVASGPAAERYSTMRALSALSRADVAVLVIDAVEGLTAQDAHVAGYAVDEGKGLVVAVNKWDLVAEKTDRTFDQYTEWIRNEVPFLDFAPIVSISAKTGQRVGRVLELAVDIWAERRRRITTGELNRLLLTATERTPPPMVRGKRPKLFYATQASIAPPTFIFFASDASAVHFSYRRYLENRLRDTFGFDGTPIRLVFRDRASVKLPRRKKSRSAPATGARPVRRPSSAKTRRSR